MVNSCLLFIRLDNVAIDDCVKCKLTAGQETYYRIGSFLRVFRVITSELIDRVT